MRNETKASMFSAKLEWQERRLRRQSEVNTWPCGLRRSLDSILKRNEKTPRVLKYISAIAYNF